MLTEFDLTLSDGRSLHAHDTGNQFAVFWHHGTPNIGAPPMPPLQWLPGLASGGCRSTGPDTADRVRFRAGTWCRWPCAFPPSSMRWESSGLR